MDYDYPLLKKVFEYYYREGMDLSNTKLYSCMHMLAPQKEMYEYFLKFGFTPENILALGKVYSSNKEIIEELVHKRIAVVQPEFSEKPFDVAHAENCKSLVDQISSDSTNIVLDDGGYLIQEARSKNVAFAVEQTSSGFRKIENDRPGFPVFNVARSKTKLTQESPLIARQIFERVSGYVDTQHIASPRILVVGLGPIGEAVYQIFKSNGATTHGLDIETNKDNLLSYIKGEQPDVIIGATGSPLFSSEDLKEIEGKHIYHFISVSSSDREFPVAEHRSGEGVHEDVVYKNFVFVNNGFPITFKGSRNELTPVEIEKTIALLMGSIFHGIMYPSQTPGFVDVPEELQDLINS